MDRFGVLFLLWLLAPVCFALLPVVLKHKDMFWAGILTYLGVLSTMWWLGNVIMIAGRQ